VEELGYFGYDGVVLGRNLAEVRIFHLLNGVLFFHILSIAQYRVSCWCILSYSFVCVGFAQMDCFMPFHLASLPFGLILTSSSLVV
jgi:hypothetical protein